jgi:hypothetical protein
MLPPGLAFAALSDRAWALTEKSDLPKYYFNFKKELKNRLSLGPLLPRLSCMAGMLKGQSSWLSKKLTPQEV